ncbi:MAG: copper amine oxidase N-terminal domain-containing protein [Firmicutes bacterium]|nr:copper amine oxidase N-terminal domain-containing protein [Bacillota bacterium]
MRKTGLLLSVLLSFNLLATAYASSGGVIKDGRTLIPVRGVFEDLGFIVDWDSSTSTATIYDSNHEVSISKNNSYFLADGNEYSLDVPAQIIDGSIYIPLRAVGEAVGADVSWISDAKQAHIRYGEHDIYVVCSNPEQPSSVNNTTSATTENVTYFYGDSSKVKDIDTKYYNDAVGVLNMFFNNYNVENCIENKAKYINDSTRDALETYAQYYSNKAKNSFDFDRKDYLLKTAEFFTSLGLFKAQYNLITVSEAYAEKITISNKEDLRNKYNKWRSIFIDDINNYLTTDNFDKRSEIRNKITKDYKEILSSLQIITGIY